jgi:hypothetical protein
MVTAMQPHRLGVGGPEHRGGQRRRLDRRAAQHDIAAVNQGALGHPLGMLRVDQRLPHRRRTGQQVAVLPGHHHERQVAAALHLKHHRGGAVVGDRGRGVRSAEIDREHPAHQ